MIMKKNKGSQWWQRMKEGCAIEREMMMMILVKNEAVIVRRLVWRRFVESNKKMMTMRRRMMMREKRRRRRRIEEMVGKSMKNILHENFEEFYTQGADVKVLLLSHSFRHHHQTLLAWVVWAVVAR